VSDRLAFTVRGDSPTAEHAHWLHRTLGAASGGPVVDLRGAPSPLADWAASGAMALTGRADGPPLAAPGNPAGAVRAALAVFEALTDARGLPGVQLLGERAAIAGLHRNGPWSCGGTFRILSTMDGQLGVSLARDSDRSLLPALTGDSTVDDWPALAQWLSGQSAAAAAYRAQLLGLPAAVVAGPPRAAVVAGAPGAAAAHRAQLLGLPAAVVAGAPGAAVVAGPPGAADAADATTGLGHASGGMPGSRIGTGLRLTPGGLRTGRGDAGRARPLVVDFTALWAGPLCAHLLGLAGAEIIKVESVHRPDGARHGPPAFFDLLHAGHASVAVDFTAAADRELLRRLVAQADVVLESSRPRALRQLGLIAEEAVAGGTIWTSITAYGREGEAGQRVGFGDDVAAAAGLVVADGPDLLPCGDAIADPISGVHAAVATVAALRADRAWLIDLSMRDITAATAVALPVADEPVPAAPPTARRATAPAAPMGYDTDRIRAALT
jgi:crotonobetainyl-CoA:carnitine CoA-transferase CaiB-like acyl-CoA transferase